jgi:hypothetical protein
MKILNVSWLIVVVTIIALDGIVVTAGAPSLLVQLASATDVITTTMGGQGGEEERGEQPQTAQPPTIFQMHFWGICS